MLVAGADADGEPRKTLIQRSGRSPWPTFLYRSTTSWLSRGRRDHPVVLIFGLALSITMMARRFHRSVRCSFHTALTSGVRRQIACRATDEGCAALGADGSQSSGGLGQASSQADAGPTADAGHNGDVLRPFMFVSRHVSDNAGRRFELEEFLARPPSG